MFKKEEIAGTLLFLPQILLPFMLLTQEDSSVPDASWKSGNSINIA